MQQRLNLTAGKPSNYAAQGPEPLVGRIKRVKIMFSGKRWRIFVKCCLLKQTSIIPHGTDSQWRMSVSGIHKEFRWVFPKIIDVLWEYLVIISFFCFMKNLFYNFQRLIAYCISKIFIDACGDIWLDRVVCWEHVLHSCMNFSDIFR